MDNSCLSIDYVTITDINEKSFAKNLSFYGKPKGLKDLKDRQKNLERELDAAAELQNDFANITCPNLKPQELGVSSYEWGFVNPKNGEVVLDVYKEYDNSEKDYILRGCVEKLNKDKWFYDILKDSKPLKLKSILEVLDLKTVEYGDELLKIQDEIEKVSRPAPAEKWRLVFVFGRANVEVVGQAAKNLYEELLGAKSNLNLRMHVKETNQTMYETKFALIVDSYEIL